MKRDLLLRQALKRLHLAPEVPPPERSLELAAALHRAPVEVLASLLDDVARSYAEADLGRRRLSHALRAGSGELFEANCGLEQRAAEAEALHAILLAAREAADLREVVRTTLAAVCNLVRWPLGYAAVPADPGSFEPTGWHSWQVDPTQGALLAPRARGSLERFVAEVVQGQQADPLGILPLLCGGGGSRWFDELFGAGVAADADVSTVSFGRPRSGLGIPVVVEGKVAVVLAFFSLSPMPPDPQVLGFADRLALQMSSMLARRRAQRAQRTQLGLLDATLEATPEGVLVVDLQGKTLESNARFAEMWRISAGEIAAAGDEADRMPAVDAQLADPDGFRAGVAALRAAIDAVASDEIRFKDGRVFARYTQPMRVGGVVAGRVWTFRDVTAERQAEAARERLEEQLRQSQKMEAVGQLAGGVAHDFNNLLTAILGYVEMLGSQLAPSGPEQRSLGEIRRAAMRAANLTRQLLAFSRKQVLDPVELDLNQAVGAMASMLQRLIGEDIQLTTRLWPALGRIKADPGQLEQVILNLAVNGRDAMAQGGDLSIETRAVRVEIEDPGPDAPPPGDYAVLTVRDTGCGMSDETRGRVFEPFFTTKEQGKGTGLGLSTVYGIVQQSGGHIRIESAPGAGSAFHVYLPLLSRPVVAKSPVSAEAEPAPGGSGTILLVEDDDAVRDLVQKVLEGRGYRILAAADHTEAVRLVASATSPIDLMLTDVIMPGMDGRRLYQRIACLRPQLRVLYMSGYTADAIAERGMLEPGTMFIAKPFTAEGLARKVAEVLHAGALA